MTAELRPDRPGARRGRSPRDARCRPRVILRAARHSVLIVGYAFHGSDVIFEPLARRMSRSAALRVRLVVNVHFEAGRSIDETVRGFARDFLEDSWPFEPRPEIYYDNRSLESVGSQRALVHAKLIVVDEKVLYLGSANFTTAAFERNIEAGARVKSSTLGSEGFRTGPVLNGGSRRGDLVALPFRRNEAMRGGKRPPGGRSGIRPSSWFPAAGRSSAVPPVRSRGHPGRAGP